MKKLLSILAVCILITSVTACTEKNSAIEKEQKTNVSETNGDYMEKYIANIDNDDEREKFLSFWNSVTSYCSGLEYKLSEIENTSNYTFDPSNSGSIPDELKEVYDFASIKFFKGFSTHKNFEMKIVGEKVELSFDDEKFYPSEYGYSEVESLIEKYNAE